MVSSMTGYGRGTAPCGSGTVTAEIRTVNSRFLELSIRSDRGSAESDALIRRIVKERVPRGKAAITISFTGGGKENAFHAVVDDNLLDAYLTALKKVRRKEGVSRKKPAVSDLLRFPVPWLTVEKETISEETWEAALTEALQAALDQLLAMRKKEGENLAQDLLKRLDLLEEKRGYLAGKQEELLKAYQEKLTARMKDMLASLGEAPDEGRILQEVAVHADKTDFTEELTRFQSHLSQFRTILSEEGPVGRKLDFLLQELNRETNTIASKTDSLDVTDQVITIKTELEKIREQVQNIE